MQKKINWIVNLKTLGILSVILGHIASPLSGFIYSWHMPLFFIAAGFFIRHEVSTKEFIVKNFRRLMAPYFIFAIIGLCFEALKRLILHRQSLDYIYELQGIFIWMDMESLTNTYAFVLWFLPALFFARILLFLILKQISSIVLQMIIIVCLFLISFGFNFPLAIDNALNAILFLFIGNIYFRYCLDSKVLYASISVLIGVFVYFGMPSLDMASKNYDNIIFSILWAAFMVFLMISILKKFNFSNEFLKIWGDNTMLIFIIHPYTNNMAHIVIEKLDWGDWYLKFFISIFLLQGILMIKYKFNGKGIFKYV